MEVFFFDVNLKMYGGKFIFSCNLHKDDIPQSKIRNPFVCEVMSIWAELHFSDTALENVRSTLVLSKIHKMFFKVLFSQSQFDHLRYNSLTLALSQKTARKSTRSYSFIAHSLATQEFPVIVDFIYWFSLHSCQNGHVLFVTQYDNNTFPTQPVAISIANVGDQIIWLNSLVRIDNQPVFRKHWMDHGVCKISHLLDEGGNLLGFDAMKSNFQELNWLEYCSIASAVKSLINKVQNEPRYEVVSTEGTSITELTSKSKVNNFICKSLLRKRISTPIRSQEKWLSDLQVKNASDIDWKDAYTIAVHCTASAKLRTFHYKFLHRRIATNDLFAKGK